MICADYSCCFRTKCRCVSEDVLSVVVIKETICLWNHKHRAEIRMRTMKQASSDQKENTNVEDRICAKRNVW